MLAKIILIGIETPTYRYFLGVNFKAMLKYKVIEREAKLGKHAGQRVQQAQQVLSGQVSFRQLCERLAKDTTVGQADIRAVLYQLADVVSEYMDLGMSVDCGELGKFRPTFGSKQVPVGEEFRTSDLKSPRITFVPRDKFKEFKFRATYERVQGSKTCKASSSKDDDEGEVYKPSGHTGL